MTSYVPAIQLRRNSRTYKAYGSGERKLFLLERLRESLVFNLSHLMEQG